MVRDFVRDNNVAGIKKLLVVLGKDLALSQNPNWRKGGLIGLASMGVALQKQLANYIQDLVPPIVTALVDPDTRVKYYATESLYNVLTVARGDALILFNEIFDVLSKLSADPDLNVQRGVEHIDSLIKNIVTECPKFDLDSFMPMLKDRLLTPKAQTRQFMLSWIRLMMVQPNVDMIYYLPGILDGLFLILSEPKPEIRQMCESVLQEFKGQIIADPSRADFAAMVNILINHSQSGSEPLVQFTAVTWLKEFVNLKRSLLPYSAGLLTALLPCLGHHHAWATGQSSEVLLYQDKVSSSASMNITEVAKALNHSLMQMVTDPSESSTVDLSSIVRALCNELSNGSGSGLSKQEKWNGTNAATKIAVLKWIHHLYVKVPDRIYPHLEELFPHLLNTLCDPSEEVILLLLEVFSKIFSSSPPGTYSDSNQGSRSRTKSTSVTSKESRGDQDSNQVVNYDYFDKFIQELLSLFRSNRERLFSNPDGRGSFIIRQLCLQVNCEDVYKSLAMSLLNHDDLDFSYLMVQQLNRILFTSSELFELRSLLKDMRTDESAALFVTLYKTWSHSPVASISLCLLTRNYEHAFNLTLICGDLDITSEFLIEVDQLVQLIESPIFACKLQTFSALI